MTKHALNAFLATSVTFVNELARLCEAVGADAKEVERGLKSERAHRRAARTSSPGAAFAGGTLARDLRVPRRLRREPRRGHAALRRRAREQRRSTRAGSGSKVSGGSWGVERPVVAVLGLAYKPGTSTLRRSSVAGALPVAGGAGRDGARPRSRRRTTLPGAARRGAALLRDRPGSAPAAPTSPIVATAWPEYRALSADGLRPQHAPAARGRPDVVPGAALGGPTRASSTSRRAATGRWHDGRPGRPRPPSSPAPAAAWAARSPRASWRRARACS